jgi:hypothetical protein
LKYGFRSNLPVRELQIQRHAMRKHSSERKIGRPDSRKHGASRKRNEAARLHFRGALGARFAGFDPPLCRYPSRSNTAPTIKGNATVASSKTSANRPPSSSGTNFPHDTASV